MAPPNPLLAILAARAQQAGSGGMRPTPGRLPPQANRQFHGTPLKGRPNLTASQRKKKRKRGTKAPTADTEVPGA